MKHFTVAICILFGFLLALLTVNANVQSENSSNKSNSADENNETHVLIEIEEEESNHIVNHTQMLPHNGTVKPNENIEWHVISNTSSDITSGLLFEDVHLLDGDKLTIHLDDENQTTIFNFSGVPGPLVIVVDVKNFTVKLVTSAAKGQRAFKVMYSENCVLNIPPTIEVISSPIYREQQKFITCTYDFKNIHKDTCYSLVFKNFSLESGSHLEVSDSDGQDATYTTIPPDIFGCVVRLNFTLNATSSANSMTIHRRDLYHGCSGYKSVSPSDPLTLRSPSALTAYNDTFECRWLVKSDSDNNVFGLLVDTLQFSSVLDTLMINDGPSELSRPIVLAGLINQNETKVEVIRTSGPYMWVSFRSEGFASNFSSKASAYGEGGYHNGSGSISMLSGTDAVFLLEVAPDKKVLLNFSVSDVASPATISIYDDFSTVSNLIALLSGPIWYPLVSPTSKMMVVAEHFNGGKFDASFSGTKSDCIHMSTSSSSDAYVVAGNCNSSCAWIVPPKNISEGVLMLEFQFVSLDNSDVIEVFRLNDSKTSVAKIVSGAKYAPSLTFSPKEGFYMKISRGNCSSKENVILVAHSTYLPGCSGNFALMPSTELQLSSPSYPNTYPLFADCQWNLTASGNTTFFYLTFNSMKLAPNHCIQITNATKGSKATPEVFYGDILPNDMLFGNIEIRFDSVGCGSSSAPMPLASDEGFTLNVTSSDCGGMMTAKIGTFNTTSSKVSKGKIICFWIVQVPYNESGSVNSVMFTVDVKGVIGNNSEFLVYDGPSVRDYALTNLTGSVWSRNNTVIFVYKRMNASAPSAAFTVNYKTISCNKTMQCGNGICLHPDWLCDGHNDCGDFTDERNCESVPVPPVPEPVTKTTGISSLTFGLVIVLFFVLGALAAVFIPKAINRYRSGRYHQFQEYSGVD